MTTQSFEKKPSIGPGWQVDPDDPHMMHWWDGSRWSGHVKPRLLFAAEDHTVLLREIRDAVFTVRSILVAWVVLSILGALLWVVLVAVANQS